MSTLLSDQVEIKKNVGSVGNKKITFIGASYKFVHKVLRDLLIVGGFDDIEICVFDIREKPLKIVTDLLSKIIVQKKTKIKLLKSNTLEEALQDSDAVILSITTGGAEILQRNFEVCLKHNINVSIGDTLGPSALARNLTTVPVAVELVKKMESLCPNALLLNFSNPMSVLTGAMARNSDIPVWGLCHSADEMDSYFSKVFNCKKEEVELTMAGVNHQSFVISLMIKGVDRTKDIYEQTKKSNARLEDNLLETSSESVEMQQDLYQILGAWPSTGHTHLAEFYPYFFTDNAIAKYRLHEEIQHVVPGREKLEWSKPHPIIMDWTYGDGPVEDLDLLTTEHAHELLWSYFTNVPFTRYINMLNHDNFIEGISKDACVEAKVTASGANITGQSIKLPPVLHSLVERWTCIHDLSITAAIDCDRDAAHQALFLDPHVKELSTVKPLLNDLLAVNKEWLAKAWFSN